MGKKVGAKLKMKGSGQGCSGLGSCSVKKTITVTLHLPGVLGTWPYTFPIDTQQWQNNPEWFPHGAKLVRNLNETTDRRLEFPPEQIDLRTKILLDFEILTESTQELSRRYNLYLIEKDGHPTTLKYPRDTPIIKNGDTIILCARKTVPEVNNGVNQNTYYNNQQIVLQNNTCLKPPISVDTAAYLLRDIDWGFKYDPWHNNDRRDYRGLIVSNYNKSPRNECSNLANSVNSELPPAPNTFEISPTSDPLPKATQAIPITPDLQFSGGKQTKRLKRRVKNHKYGKQTKQLQYRLKNRKSKRHSKK